MRDDREFSQFDRSFGNSRWVRIIIPAGSQNLSRAEVEEMIALLEDFVSALRASRLSVARQVES